MEEFTRDDVHAVNRAMLEARHLAEERKDKMPSSANALRMHARELHAVREKILDRLPPEVRVAYPPVRDPDQATFVNHP